MSAIIIQYAEEKAKRLSLRNKTHVSTVNRLLGRADCGDTPVILSSWREWQKPDTEQK